ncbi:IclR family transcriptional regulator C-terminal domain-containing protein [Pseudomonas sp. 21LCFQ010]|uniref:IclR family transcriptional regulator domain-containing protein n=1 Tax=Pseudomonas sp. 21LCFQ010 TaxID=2957506 RepID=UPI0025B74235|nr:IclR family transcriptional regulator C-terminal domain-containing protein [Pseudomonas sp. 21LCFQ010]
MIEVLDALVSRAGSEPWGVRELAAQLLESRSTVNRILGSLVDRGLAVEAGTGKYSLGPRINVLLQKLRDSNVLLGCHSNALSELADATQSTALVCIYCPVSGGYFVAACSEAKATLTFRPQLGTLYPLSFGDIGRCFAEFLAADRHLPQACDVADNSGKVSKVPDAHEVFSEAEFPKASSTALRRLNNGLLIAVSVHSVSDPQPAIITRAQAGVMGLIEEIVALTEAAETGSRQAPVISTEEAKSTLTRLERLLLLACAFPAGLKNSVGLHEQMLCNEATAKRLIQSAIQTGIVNFQDTGLYPGAKLYQWAARTGSGCENLAQLTRPILLDLVQETGETIAFLSYEKTTGRAEFLEVIHGWRPIQYTLQTHTQVPLYAGAAGKAVLAYCDQSSVESIKLEKITDTTITSREVLMAELSNIRNRGWATGDGERVLGAFGVAVPFFVDGTVRGSISATIPQYRKDERDLTQLTTLMRQATAKIERLLSLGITAPCTTGI